MSGYPADLTLNAKLLPRTLKGTLPLASAIEMSLTTHSRAAAPYPPGNVCLNGHGLSTWPSSTVGTVVLSWSHRSRAEQGVGAALVPQDSAAPLPIEGTLTVEVLIAGVVKRTWTGLTGLSQDYTLAQRLADDADATKLTQFRLTPVSGPLTGTVRLTPEFVMG